MKHPKRFLHIGSGRKRMANTPFAGQAWQEVRLDIDPTVEPDVVGTMLDLSPIPANSIDAIYSSHNLEHIYPHEVSLALAEFRRVLRDDGFLLITCPDLRSVCALVADDKLTDPAYLSGMGPIAPIDILYGLRSAIANGNPFMAHRGGFTERSLREVLQTNHFPIVATAARPHCFDLWALAAGPALSREQVRQLAEQLFFKPSPASAHASDPSHD